MVERLSIVWQNNKFCYLKQFSLAGFVLILIKKTIISDLKKHPQFLKLETWKFGSRQPHPLQKMHSLNFSNFVWELRNEGFTKLTHQIRQACYFWPPSLTSNTSGPRQNIKKLVSWLCALNMWIIPVNFQLSSFKTVEEDTDRHFLSIQALMKNLNSPSFRSLH